MELYIVKAVGTWQPSFWKVMRQESEAVHDIVYTFTLWSDSVIYKGLPIPCGDSLDLSEQDPRCCHYNRN